MRKYGKLRFWTFAVNCIAWLISLFRICTNQEEAFDYIVVFFTFNILVYDFYRIFKEHKEKKKSKKGEKTA